MISEIDLPADYDLTNLVCTSANSENPANSPSKFSLTGSNVDTSAYEPGDDTATIELAPGDTATCRFTNTDRRGSIEIIKDSGDSSGTFDFTQDIIGVGFQLTTTGEPASTDDMFVDIDPGTYFVSEQAQPGWELTGIECTSGNGISSFVYSGATGSRTTAFESGDDTVRITLGAGDDDVSCTFTNLDVRGQITVTQDTQPDNEQPFTFEPSPNLGGIPFDPGPLAPIGPPQENFDLTDIGQLPGPTMTFYEKVPGETYTVTQIQVPGWELTSIECTSTGGSTFAYTGSGLDDPAAFEPGDVTAEVTLANEDIDVDCVFTNVDRRGTVTIVLDALGDPQEFGFTEDFFGEVGSFTLDNDGGTQPPDTQPFPDVVAGEYSVVGDLVEGWTLVGFNCDDSNSTFNTSTRTADIVLDPNEAVTCTYEVVSDTPPPIE